MTARSAGRVLVGVTGHRQIDIRSAALRRAVVAALHEIQTRFPLHRITLLSGLAEGADRLVAEMAREQVAATLVAVVPLPDDLYEQDFASASSIAVYRAMRAGADRVIRAPLRHRRRRLSAYGDARNGQYAWIGAFIARRADVLIAVWDGEPSRGYGGTADVVGWFLDGHTPRDLRISKAPRLAGAGTPRRLIHIDPADGETKRRRPSRRRPKLPPHRSS